MVSAGRGASRRRWAGSGLALQHQTGLDRKSPPQGPAPLTGHHMPRWGE